MRCIAIYLMFLSSCAAASEPEVAWKNDIKACEAQRVCRLAGETSIVEAYHVQMAKIDLGESGCILASLSSPMMRKLKSGEKYLSVEGRIYYPPKTVEGSGEWVGSVEIGGRRVGWGLCRDYILYVK